MITPKFEAEQNETHVILKLIVPHVKISSFDFYIEKELFKFYAKPYFLKLVFPHELQEDGTEKGVYDIDTNTLTVHLPKKTPGQYFENLDLLTLLKQKVKNKTEIDYDFKSSTNLIEEIEEDTENNNNINNNEDEKCNVSNNNNSTLNEELIHRILNTNETLNPEDFDIDFNWEYPQINSDQVVNKLLNNHNFGFNKQYSQYFKGLEEEIEEIVDCCDLDHFEDEDKKVMSKIQEEASFNYDHYMYDYINTETIEELMKFEPEIYKEEEENEEKKSSVFSEEEKEMLRNLPNKSYGKFTRNEIKSNLLILVDILLSYCYDYRLNYGDSSVGSAWTICKLTASFAWLRTYKTLKEVILTNLKRQMIFPLYRNFDFSMKVLDDLKMLFNRGKRYIIKYLIKIYEILKFSEFKHHFNNLFLTDYCIWIQSVSSKYIRDLSNQLNDLNILKSDIELPLLPLEGLAIEAREEDEELQNSNNNHIDSENVMMSDQTSMRDEDEDDGPDTNNNNNNNNNNHNNQVLIEEIS